MLSAEEWTALGLSVRVALAATAFSALPAIALGRWLARNRSFAALAVEVAVSAPLVVPPVVTGYLLLLLLGPLGPGGRLLDAVFGVSLAFTWQGAALASAVVAFPLFVRTVRVAMEGVDARLEEAAATLGASPRAVFTQIVLPRALPGVAAGAVLAFARSLGEFGATITFAGNIAGSTRTIPLAIFAEAQTPGGDEAALRLSIVSIVLSVLAVAAGELAVRRQARGEEGGRS